MARRKEYGNPLINLIGLQTDQLQERYELIKRQQEESKTNTGISGRGSDNKYTVNLAQPAIDPTRYSWYESTKPPAHPVPNNPTNRDSEEQKTHNSIKESAADNSEYEKKIAQLNSLIVEQTLKISNLEKELSKAESLIKSLTTHTETTPLHTLHGDEVDISGETKNSSKLSFNDLNYAMHD